MVDEVEVQMISYGYLMLAFALGSASAIVASWVASLYTRKACMNEPYSAIPDKDLTLEDIEDEIDDTNYETQEECEHREEQELALLRGHL